MRPQLRCSVVFLWCTLFSVLGAGGVARASMSQAISLKELSEQADLVFTFHRGKSVSHRDKTGRMVTDVTLEVDSVAKGKLKKGQRITVRCLGGVMGNTGVRVIGTAPYSAVKHGLAFLRKWDGQYVTLGMSQGLFEVTKTDGRTEVRPGSHGMALVDRKGRVGGKGAIAHPRPLDDVLTEVRVFVRMAEERRAAQAQTR